MNCKDIWRSDAGTFRISVVLSTTIALVCSLVSVRAATQPQFSARIPTGVGGYAAALGDYNRDGTLDLVVRISSGITLRLGRGDGTFAATTNIYPVYCDFLTAGDFNGDGNLDVCAVGMDGNAVLVGDGAGRLVLRTNLTRYVPYPSDLALGDLNLDGKLDMAIVGGGVSVGFGRGDGSFTNGTNVMSSYPNSVRGVAVGDCNGDGRPDMVLCVNGTPTHPNSLCVMLNRGDGLFDAPQCYPSALYDNHYALVLGDFNGDGMNDAAVTDEYDQSVTIWVNNGTGGFTAANRYSLGFSGSSLACADLNGDGTPDLVVAGSGVMRVLAGDGRGGFALGPRISFSAPVMVGDLNNDGRPDLASPSAVLLNQTPPTLRLSSMPGYVQLDWLATFGAGFSLEYSTNLTDPSSWSPFPYPPVAIGNQRAVTDWSTEGRKFYRLRRP
jgi:hypothetical protein